eukprot:259129-Rhodomonas_salina.1
MAARAATHRAVLRTMEQGRASKACDPSFIQNSGILNGNSLSSFQFWPKFSKLLDVYCRLQHNSPK